MNKKLLCGIAALGFAISSVFAADSYYLFEFTDRDATKPTSPWGGSIMGFKYGGATADNPQDPYGGANGIVVYSDGVAKLNNVGWPGAYPGAFIALKHEGGAGVTGSPSDCASGFSYWYKSTEAHTFILQFPMSECDPDSDYGNQWSKSGIAAESSNWTKVTHVLGDLSNNDATGCGKTVAKDLSKVEQISFGFSGSNDSKSGLNLMIANIICVGSGSSIDESGISLPAVDYTVQTPVLPSSSSNGDSHPSSSSTTPILSNGVAITGLNVTHFARSLHIASGKDATLSLFDMHGKQVFSKKVFAGESVVSLENQRQGVYYAVVRSGSLKQTVKVVLK